MHFFPTWGRNPMAKRLCLECRPQSETKHNTFFYQFRYSPGCGKNWWAIKSWVSVLSCLRETPRPSARSVLSSGAIAILSLAWREDGWKRALGFTSGEREKLRGDLTGTLPPASRQDCRFLHYAKLRGSLVSAPSPTQPPAYLPLPSSFFSTRPTSVCEPELFNFVNRSHPAQSRFRWCILCTCLVKQRVGTRPVSQLKQSGWLIVITDALLTLT